MTSDASSLLVLPMEPKDRIDLWFDRLKGEVKSVLDQESGLQETVLSLRNDLSLYKRAYSGIESEREQLMKAKEEAEKQRDELELRLKGNRIVALLDGDGAIFSSDLISQGQAGGHIAAQKLADSILQYMSSQHGLNHYQLWVYVFLNKRGLAETFGRYGLYNQKVKFDDFVLGFNQAAERFMMVDVGTTKEAADSKIKAYLEDEVRLPQTYKVLFGGCHDNGYVTTLRSQITAGFKHKIALLQSYSEMATGIADLDLPCISCPDLFMLQKLGPHSSASPAPVIAQATVVPNPPQAVISPPLVPLPASPSPAPQQPLIAAPPSAHASASEELHAPSERRDLNPAAPVALFKKVERRDSIASLSSMLFQPKLERRDSVVSLPGSLVHFKSERRDSIASNSSATGFEAIEVPNANPPEPPRTILSSPVAAPLELPLAEPEPPKRPNGPPPTYSSAVLSPRRPPTPDLDSCGSSAASDVSDEHPSPRLSSSRHINPNIPLSKHKPPPCTLFYLANCKYGSECKYAHNYILEAEHFEEIKTNAKKAPCPSVNKGEPCIWGEACCYGHFCPGLTKCIYHKQGRCKFTGVDMHKASSANN